MLGGMGWALKKGSGGVVVSGGGEVEEVGWGCVGGWVGRL